MQNKEGEEEGAQQRVSMPTDNGDVPRTSEAPVEVSTSLSSSDHQQCRQKAEKSASPLETSGSTAQRPSRQGSLNRSTHSTLLQEGENHEVWRPGCQRSRYNRSRGTIADRQKSLLMRISSYHSTSCGLDVASEGGVGSWRTREGLEEEDREKRLSQWKRIEEEAMRGGMNWSAQVGGKDERGEGRRPTSALVDHHVLPCRDSSLFPSTPNLSSTYTSMPDVSRGMVASHPPPQSGLHGCGGAPIESQTLPRRLHLYAGRHGGGGEEGNTATPQGTQNVEQSDLEEDNQCASWRLQRHTSSPHPATPPRCHPSHVKRESFVEMVPIPEEEYELSTSLHSRLPPSNAHDSPQRLAHASGIMPPLGKPLGGNASGIMPPMGKPLGENASGITPPVGKPLGENASGITPPVGKPLGENASGITPPVGKPLGENASGITPPLGKPLGENASGITPPLGKPLGGNALTPSSSHTAIPEGKNMPAPPSPRGSRTHQGGVLLPPCDATYLGMHNLGGQDGISQRGRGGPSPTHHMPVGPRSKGGPHVAPQGGFNPVNSVLIMGLQESPGRQPHAHIAAGKGSPLIQPRQQQCVAAPTSRYSTCAGRSCKQTDV